MPRFFISLGLASLLSVGWVLRAQEPTEDEPVTPSAEPIENSPIEPGAEPVDPAVLDEKDIPHNTD